MKIISRFQIIINKVTKYCTAIEYPNGDKDIWGAVIKINGRYPTSGFTVNQKCKELVYVISGKEKLGVNKKITQVNKGDQLVIEPGEKFYW